MVPLICVLGGFLAGYIMGGFFPKVFRKMASSIAGAFLVIRGVGCYLPGFPNLFDMNTQSVWTDPSNHQETLYYMAGFILLSLSGFIYQAHFINVDKEQIRRYSRLENELVDF